MRIQSLSGPKSTAHDGEITAPTETVKLEIAEQRLTVYRATS